MKKLKITTIDFVGKRKIAITFSALLILASIISLGFNGLKLGIDFTGGTLLEMQSSSNIDLPTVREKLTANNFSDFNVQHFGSLKEVLLRLKVQKVSSAVLSSEIMQILGEDFSMRRIEFVGPKVGEELTNSGGLALLYALIGILIYVALRFEYRFALGSIAALIHDVIITLGVFSITQVQFDLTVLAAILAVIGYSLNDTIVVFDRIRENFLNTRETENTKVVNNAINQTLSRTITTSFTTILVLVALFVLGGEVIHFFALALIIGVFVGTYSSIYVASSLTLLMGISKQDLLPSEKEKQEVDNRP